jgi:hypothetical protein
LHLETIDGVVHVSEIPSPFWSPSCHRRHLEAVVASPESNQSRLAGESSPKPYLSQVSPLLLNHARQILIERPKQITYSKGYWTI